MTISVNSYFFSFDLAISKLFSIFIPPECIEMKNWTEIDQNNRVNNKLLIRATWGSNIVLHDPEAATKIHRKTPVLEPLF